MCASKKVCYLLCQQVKRVYKSQGVEQVKMISQVSITMQIYHFHLKFSWNSFNINNKRHLKWELNSYWRSWISSAYFLAISGLFLSQNWEVCHIVWTQLQFPQSNLSFKSHYFVKRFINKVICSLSCAQRCQRKTRSHTTSHDYLSPSLTEIIKFLTSSHTSI
jgi:hypothetical protein